MNDYVDIDVEEVIAETPKAILVSAGGEEHWVPRSLISDDSEVYEKGHSGILIIPEWFAEQEGMI